VGPSLTLDTGALIAIESRRVGFGKRIQRARSQEVPITVPAVVVAEWWRGRSDFRDDILAMVKVEPMSEGLAKLAGEALATVRGATASDAIVMASAAQRGDVVYTSDVDDLERLRRFFPAVRVLGV
jgi:predicted nucleic acid-binding protein